MVQYIRDLSILRDVLDIIVLAVVIYQVLVILQRTRATQLILGILYFAILFFIAYLLKMTATLWIFERLAIIIPVALIILFQNEIRSLFERAGRRSFLLRTLSYRDREDLEQMIETIVQALEEMSESRTGAIIVIEQEISLHEYENTGERIDARVSKDLIKAIFQKGSPLHDGAVIIKGDRIITARSFLPLSVSHDIPAHLGTRHRAALGITEISDAISLVVSEETGNLSLFHAGRPAFRLSPVTMRHMVMGILLPDLERETPLFQLKQNLSRFGFKGRKSVVIQDGVSVESSNEVPAINDINHWQDDEEKAQSEVQRSEI